MTRNLFNDGPDFARALEAENYRKTGILLETRGNGPASYYREQGITEHDIISYEIHFKSRNVRYRD